MSANTKGTSGNTVSDLREVALSWDESALTCDSLGEPGLASRDRRFATAMREAADILEALRYDS
jgi:hypothetical protein